MMLFTLVAAASLISSIAQAHTYCVSTASGLQDALSAAASNGENDTLLIEQGSYTGNFVYGSSEAFDVTVEGGYTISCADRVADPANTVLDGNFTGGVLALASSTVVHFSVEGVTIQNGAIANHGAGLYVSTEGTVTLTNNRVSGNTTGSGGSYHGGGIYVSSGSTVTLTNNTVSGNSSNYGGYANRGGGIYVYGGNGTVTLTNNTVSGNSVNSQGGGIYVSDSSAITLTSNLVSGNTVNGTGGGIYVNSHATLTNNTVSGNAANNTGGGIYVNSHATLTNNTVSGNTASNTGGGIYVYSPYNFNSPVTLTMTNNTVSENTADYGGGLYYYCGYEFPIADIYNNIIWNNSAVVEGSDLYLNNDADNDYLPSLINVFNNDFWLRK